VSTPTALAHAISVSKEALSMLTRDDLDALGADLLAADDAADPQKLAVIAWQLYGEAGTEQAEIDRLRAALRSRTGAGR